ncbi:MAG: hypothetical protein U9Q81_20870 [Pseudomonadota bacterium]|nr:hypothetical protein [Pseudomonadota bacterium]
MHKTLTILVLLLALVGTAAGDDVGRYSVVTTDPPIMVDTETGKSWWLSTRVGPDGLAGAGWVEIEVMTEKEESEGEESEDSDDSPAPEQKG